VKHVERPGGLFSSAPAYRREAKLNPVALPIKPLPFGLRNDARIVTSQSNRSQSSNSNVQPQSLIKCEIFVHCVRVLCDHIYSIAVLEDINILSSMLLLRNQKCRPNFVKLFSTNILQHWLLDKNNKRQQQLICNRHVFSICLSCRFFVVARI
jgi:hypothetical protein